MKKICPFFSYVGNCKLVFVHTPAIRLCVCVCWGWGGGGALKLKYYFMFNKRQLYFPVVHVYSCLTLPWTRDCLTRCRVFELSLSQMLNLIIISNEILELKGIFKVLIWVELYQF